MELTKQQELLKKQLLSKLGIKPIILIGYSGLGKANYSKHIKDDQIK